MVMPRDGITIHGTYENELESTTATFLQKA
jgi:hypothetical protein